MGQSQEHPNATLALACLSSYYYPVQSPFRVTWSSLYYTIKTYSEGLLTVDYPMMHFVSSGSNVFHDDNAPPHKAQVVTECFEWHDNAVSHIPKPLLYIDMIQLYILYIDTIQTGHLRIYSIWSNKCYIREYISFQNNKN